MRGGANLKIFSDVTKNTVTLLLRMEEIEAVIDSRWIELIKGDLLPDSRFEITRGREFVKASFFGEGYLLVSNYFKTLEKEEALKYLSEYVDFVNEGANAQEYILGFNNIFFDGEKLNFVKFVTAPRLIGEFSFISCLLFLFLLFPVLL